MTDNREAAKNIVRSVYSILNTLGSEQINAEDWVSAFLDKRDAELRATIAGRDNAAHVASSRAVQLKESLDHIIKHGSCVVAGQPYPESCAKRISAESELAKERDAHKFTCTKWFRERKELTDALASARADLDRVTKERIEFHREILDLRHRLGEQTDLHRSAVRHMEEKIAEVAALQARVKALEAPVDDDWAQAALKFIDGFNGDERCGLNSHYSEGLALAYRQSRREVAALSAKLAALTTDRKE